MSYNFYKRTPKTRFSQDIYRLNNESLYRFLCHEQRYLPTAKLQLECMEVIVQEINTGLIYSIDSVKFSTIAKFYAKEEQCQI